MRTLEELLEKTGASKNIDDEGGLYYIMDDEDLETFQKEVLKDAAEGVETIINSTTGGNIKYFLLDYCKGLKE